MRNQPDGRCWHGAATTVYAANADAREVLEYDGATDAALFTSE